MKIDFASYFNSQINIEFINLKQICFCKTESSLYYVYNYNKFLEHSKIEPTFFNNNIRWSISLNPNF